jgi:hypothetical protein
MCQGGFLRCIDEELQAERQALPVARVAGHLPHLQ